MSARARLALFSCTAAIAVGLSWWLVFGHVPWRCTIDLYQSYLAGELFARGQHDAIYHATFFADASTRAPAWAEGMARLGIPDDNHGTFAYGPIYLALITPLVLVTSLGMFSTLVFAANALAAVTLGVFSMRLAGEKSTRKQAVAGLVVGLLAPSVYAAMLGQNVLIAIALGVVAFDRLLAGRTALAIALLLLSCACKPWCAALLLVVPFVRGWRVFASAALAYVVIFVALPIALFPRAIVEGYAAVNRSLLTLSVLAFNDVSVRAFVHRLSWPGWGVDIVTFRELHVGGRALAVEVVLVVTIVASFVVGMVRARPRKPVIVAVACALSLVPLGVCWTHYLVATVPAIALSRTSAARAPRIAGLVQLAVLVSLHLFSRWIPSSATIAVAPAAFAIVFALPIVSTLALSATLVRSR